MEVKNDRITKVDYAIGNLTVGSVRDLRISLAIAAAAAQENESRNLLHELMSIMETRVSMLPGYDNKEIQSIYMAAKTSIAFIDHIMNTVREMEEGEEEELHPFTIN